MSKSINHYVEKSSSPRRFRVIFMYTDQYIRISFHAPASLPLFFFYLPPPPSFGDFYTLYRPLFAIWALHLLIIQASTWAPILSDTSFSPLWVVVVKATLFRGFLHINAARNVVVVYSMWCGGDSFCWDILYFHPFHVFRGWVSVVWIYLCSEFSVSKEEFLLGPFFFVSRDKA